MTTSFYAAILAIIFIVLSVNVILGRGRHKVLIGDAANHDMIRRIRAQANFAEYTPLFLILLLLTEYAGVGADYIHAAGIAFVLGRIAHAYALTRAEGHAATAPSIFRLLGMICTFTPLAALAITLLVNYQGL